MKPRFLITTFFLIGTCLAPRCRAGETAAASQTSATTDIANAESADYFRNAIKAGSRDAYVDLGFCYELGLGGEAINSALALQSFSVGAQCGSAAAMYQLALCYASGMKVKADFAAALSWLHKSAVLGYAPAVAAMERPSETTWTADFDFMRRMTTPSPVFGAEATRLFQAISGECRLKEGALPETPSPPTVRRALHATAPGLAEIAHFHQKFLEEISRSPQMMADMKSAEGVSQMNFAGGLLGSLLRGDDTLDGANDLLEGVLGTVKGTGTPQMGRDLQHTMNGVWEWQFDLQNAQAEMRQAAREFANRTSAQVPTVPDAIAARMTIRTVTMAGLAVTNRTDRALHHCLIVSGQHPPGAKIKGEAFANETLANSLNKAIGVRPQYREAQAEGGNFQTKILTLEHGYLAYLPVLPAHATVEVPLCEPLLLANGPYVDAAIWCDELKAESPQAMNFKEAQAAYEQALDAWRREQAQKQRAAAAQPGSPAKKLGLGQWKNPLDEPARRVGR